MEVPKCPYIITQRLSRAGRTRFISSSDFFISDDTMNLKDPLIRQRENYVVSLWNNFFLVNIFDGQVRPRQQTAIIDTTNFDLCLPN